LYVKKEPREEKKARLHSPKKKAKKSTYHTRSQLQTYSLRKQRESASRGISAHEKAKNKENCTNVGRQKRAQKSQKVGRARHTPKLELRAVPQREADFKKTKSSILTKEKKKKGETI